jgi:hypothetical protein
VAPAATIAKKLLMTELELELAELGENCSRLLAAL